MADKTGPASKSSVISITTKFPNSRILLYSLRTFNRWARNKGQTLNYCGDLSSEVHTWFSVSSLLNC